MGHGKDKQDYMKNRKHMEHMGHTRLILGRVNAAGRAGGAEDMTRLREPGQSGRTD